MGNAESRAVHEAAQSDNIASVQQLLDEHPKLLDNRGEDGRTLLYIAALRNNLPLVRDLISRGADVNKPRTDGACAAPLHVAAQKGFSAVAEELLDTNRCDINATTQSGKTALFLAAAGNQAELVSLLLSRGADANQREQEGWSPLHVAARDGHGEVVELLLASGTAALAETKDGRTALDLARSGGHKGLVLLLQQHSLCEAAATGQTDVVQALLDAGADINAADQAGRPPLFVATSNNKRSTVELLLSRPGVDVNTATQKGACATALHVAAQKGFADIAQRLLETSTCSVDATTKNGATPLFLAAADNSIEVALLLLNKGADVNAADLNGWTPLQVAAHRGHKRVVDLLSSRGATAAKASRSTSSAGREQTYSNGHSGRFTAEHAAAAEALLGQAQTLFHFMKDDRSGLHKQMQSNNLWSLTFSASVVDLATGALFAIKLGELIVKMVQDNFDNIEQAKLLREQVQVIGSLMKELEGRQLAATSWSDNLKATIEMAIEAVGRALKEAALLVQEWDSKRRTRIGKLFAFVSSSSLNQQFRAVLEHLRTAFNSLGHVVGIAAAMWPQQSAQGATEADMQRLVAEVKQRGEQGQRELKALVEQQSAADREHMQQVLGTFSTELICEFKLMGVGLHTKLDKILEELSDIKRNMQEQSSFGAASDAGARSFSSTGSGSFAKAGRPEDLWSMSEADIIAAADKNGSGDIDAMELSRFLGSYGLRVGDTVARQLIKEYNVFEGRACDVKCLKQFLKSWWAAMCDAQQEVAAGEVVEPVLTKEQCCRLMRVFAGGRGVQVVEKQVKEHEAVSYEILLHLVLSVHA